MSIEIASTLRNSPIRAVIYGPDGIGKSTLANGAPDAVFINLEDGGLDHIDARAVPGIAKWSDIIEAVEALTIDSRCGSIVIDSLDWAEQLCWAHVCEMGDEKGRRMKNIEAFGYGKGYVAAYNEWRNLLAALTRAGKLGKHIILTAHAVRKSVKDPVREDYEQIQIKLNERAAGLIREWVHIVGFAEFDVATVTDKDDGNRTKGIFTGKRILRTGPHAGYQSKSRLQLPDKLPLDWASFYAAVQAARPPSLDALNEQLSVKLAELDDDAVMRGCEAFLRERGRSLDSLMRAIKRVDEVLAEKKKEV